MAIEFYCEIATHIDRFPFPDCGGLRLMEENQTKILCMSYQQILST